MSAAPDANLTEARRWLLQAEQKFAAAIATGAASQWPEACFWCQQAAELALKALMIRHGERARVHGLLHLVERLSAHCPEITALSDAARRLDRFYVPTRYPDSLPRGTSADYFAEKDFKDAQADATQTLDFSRQRLLQP
jgi:HEPN domain-containing protein